MAGDRIYRRISIARPAERDARGGGRSGEVNDDTLERKRQAKEGRKKRGRAKKGSNNNDRRKKKTKKKEKEDLDHADWFGLDCWLLPFFRQLPLRFSTHDSNIYYASSF